MTEKKESIRKKKTADSVFDDGRDDYIKSLETGIQFLKKEIDNLKNEISQKNDLGSEKAQSVSSDFSIFFKATNELDVLSKLHELLVPACSAIESNLFFYNEHGRLEPVFTVDTSSVINEQVEYLEEEGIIDWVKDNKEVSIIPNMHETLSRSTFFVIAPINIRNNSIGVFVVRTLRDRDSFLPEDLKYVESLAETAAFVIENIKSSAEIDSLNKKVFALNSRLLYFSRLMAVGDLAITLSKELDNPLKIINANIELMQSGMGDNLRRLQIIKSQFDKVQNVKLKLADLSTVDDEEQIPLKLSDLLENALSLVNSQLAGEGILVEKDFLNSEISILGYKSQLEHVLLNMIQNAKNEMPDGGVVSVGIYKLSDRKVSIHIADRGKGISEEKINYIFDPANPLDEKFSGLSVTLYMAKNIIEAHKGKIFVYSDIGKGTTFKIVLPIYSA